jgi:photosystem II stability/assembly factor-like uncharacterized protein
VLRSSTGLALVLLAVAAPDALRAQAPSPGLLDLVPDPLSSSVLWATTAGGGVFRSADSGVTWQPRTSLPADGARLVATSAPPLLLASTAAGLYRSEDGAQTWTRSDAGFSEPPGIAASPRSAVPIYAIAASGVFRSFDAGRTWLASPGLPSPPLFMSSFAVASNPATAYAAFNVPYPSASPIEGIYETTDAGATWTRTAFRPSAASIHGASALFVDPAAATTAFALSTSCGFGCSFTTPVRTDDGGATWRSTGFLPGSADAHGVLYAALGAVGQYIPSYSGGYRSRDHGVTSEPFSPDGSTVRRLFASSASVTIVAETDSGALFASTDSGTTWSAISPPPAPRFDCPRDSSWLCLEGGRFQARVFFRGPNGQGSGIAFPLTVDSGAFWFFTPNNLELVVKVVDGVAVNGRHWVFVGALTDLEYDLEILDMATGARWSRHNDAGKLQSVADTEAFQGP